MTGAAVIESVAYRAVPTDRAYHVGQVVSETVNGAALDPDTEAQIRVELDARLSSLISLTDDLVAAHAQLRATNERLDRHVQMHDLCVIGAMQGCWAYQGLLRTRDQYQRHADRAMRAFLRGH